MRIDLGDMEGYIMAGQGEEEEERRLEEELEGREARLEEELDLQAAEQGEEVCKVARPVSGRHPDHRHLLHPASDLALVAAHPRRRVAPARLSSATQCWSAGGLVLVLTIMVLLMAAVQLVAMLLMMLLMMVLMMVLMLLMMGMCRDGKLVTSYLLLVGLSTLLRSSLETVPRSARVVCCLWSVVCGVMWRGLVWSESVVWCGVGVGK